MGQIKIILLHNELDKFVNLDAGFSIMIEIDGKQMLMDTSQSNSFAVNAKKAGIDLKKTDYLVLSHGHWDHTNGIKFLEGIPLTIVAHPDCFEKKYRDVRYIGPPLTKEEIDKKFKLELHRKPYSITENVIFLGQIPRKNSFEGKKPVGKKEDGTDDFVLDDSAIAIKTNKGLIVITGCGHSGVCNTIEYAKKVAKEDQVFAVVGGFHLFDKEQTNKTIEYFRKHQIKRIYPMHCLDEYAFSEFEKVGAKRMKTLERIEI